MATARRRRGGEFAFTFDNLAAVVEEFTPVLETDGADQTGAW
jgi:hypothetical protein